jgi:hypothetical protein
MKFSLDNFSETDCPKEFIEDWLGAALDNAMAEVDVFWRIPCRNGMVANVLQ